MEQTGTYKKRNKRERADRSLRFFIVPSHYNAVVFYSWERFYSLTFTDQSKQRIQKTANHKAGNKTKNRRREEFCANEEEELALPDNSAIFFIYSKFKIYCLKTGKHKCTVFALIKHEKNTEFSHS